MVRLVKTEHIPSHCGVCVEAIVEGCDGIVLVEPKLGCAGLALDSMLVEPDSSGKATIVLSNHSVSGVCLGVGQKISFAQSCEQYVGSSEEGVSLCEQAERGGDICEVAVDTPGGRKEKLRNLLHLPSGCDDWCWRCMMCSLWRREKERMYAMKLSLEIVHTYKAASAASSVCIAEEG